MKASDLLAIGCGRPRRWVRTTAPCCCFLIATALTPLKAELSNFRSIDGSDNNVDNPSWGAADTQIIRHLYDAFYPGDQSGRAMLLNDLPNPRELSNRVSDQQDQRITNDRGLSDFIWQWGQFLTHDMDLTPNGQGNNTDPEPVVSIPVPVGDAHFDPDGDGGVIIPFNRSDYDLDTGDSSGNPRQQVNRVTSYIDASNVYGSDMTRAQALRDFEGGKLKMNPTISGLLALNDDPNHMLPNDNNNPHFDDAEMFLAGDVRANEQPGLTVMHTVFVREHNRLAGRIEQSGLASDDETIYQLARKIVGAEMQVVTYGQFLPALLGDQAPRAESFRYRSDTDASITQTFSHALFRFGHSMNSPRLQLVNEDGSSENPLELRDGFFNPDLLKDDPDNVDRILRGLAGQFAEENDLKFVDEVRNFLFGPPGAGGLDLMALDIQRGRDHGLPSYNETRRSYLLEPVQNVTDITSVDRVRDTLTAAYGLIADPMPDTVDPNIENIDLIVGALAEDHVDGASVGQLILTVVADQFSRLRDGDRFFFLNTSETEGREGPGLYDRSGKLNADVAALFAPEGISDLRDIRLSDIIRWNTPIANIRDNVFFVPEPTSGLVLAVGAGWVLGRRRRAMDQC